MLDAEDDDDDDDMGLFLVNPVAENISNDRGFVADTAAP